MASIDEPLLEEETGIHHVPKKIHTETVAITTGETLATTEADGMPIYAARSSTSQPVNASTMLFVGTEDAVRGNLPSKSASGHKLHIQTYPRYDGFRKFYDQGEYPHTVLLLHRNTTRLGEFDDPLGLFFHRTRIGRVSLVFMGENDQENFAALCKLDPNIDALDKAGRVFFWNELEGTSRQKVDELVLRIQDNLGHPLSATQKKSITRGVRSRRMVLPDKTWHFNKLQGLLAGLAVLALFFSLLCSFPAIQKHRAPEITVPGAEKWTPAERATYLDELRKLERERLVVEAERNRIDSVRRKMIEKINDIEELENSINREKRNIVCGLLDRREALLKEYTSASHARDHITQLKREIARMEAELKHLPAGGREQLELERNISDRKFDVRVWEEGLEELLKVEEELARSDVFSWSEFPTYCALPAAAH